MKYLFSFVLIICNWQTAFCQPILTASNSTPVAGDEFIVYICPGSDCSGSVAQPGASGANVVWDFSNLSGTKQVDTVRYVSCASTPYCSKFPGSNLASIQGSNLYAYYAIDTNQFAVTGTFANGDTNYYAGDVELQYPFTYNSAYTVYFYSHSLPDTNYAHDTITVVCDGYGTLKLPTATFNNVLRVHSTSKTTDSVIINGVAHVSYNKQENYTWRMPGYYNALLDIVYGISPVDTYYTYTFPSNLSVPVFEPVSPLLTLYPNPVTNNLHMEFMSENENVRINLIDMLGKECGIVCEKNFEKGMQNVKCNVNALPSGIYFVRMQNSKGTTTKKIEIRH